MEAVNTTTSTTKLHFAWGMTTRASGIVALCSTNTPVQRVKHVTARQIGERNVFFIDLGIGRVDRAQAAAYILGDDTRKAFWLSHAAGYGYTEEQCMTVLNAIVSKNAAVPTMPQAAETQTGTDAADEAAEG